MATDPSISKLTEVNPTVETNGSEKSDTLDFLRNGLHDSRYPK